MMSDRTYSAFFPFCGLGAGARGFLDAQVTMFDRPARFRSLGGIDNDPAACADFEYLTGSPALSADVAMLTPAELRAFAGDEAPDVVFSSPPCKSFSALLSKKNADAPKYHALSRLVLDWVRLMLAAWPTPPRLFLLENVPRIASRGAGLLREVKALLRRAGYVFHAATHDCGELGGLAQHRTRFLLVARHQGRVPPLLYQPVRKRVRACGEVLEQLPMPGDPAGGAMHQLPKISWLNWVRLALIPAGGDWRDLPGTLEEGQARREVFRRHHVARWDAPAETVAGPGSNGPSAVADPRAAWTVATAYDHGYGVLSFHEPSPTVAGGSYPGQGAYSIADPRWTGGVHGQANEQGTRPAAVLAAGAEDRQLLELDGPNGSKWLRDCGAHDQWGPNGQADASACLGDDGRSDPRRSSRAARVRQPSLRETGTGSSPSRHACQEHGRDGGEKPLRSGVGETEHEDQRRGCAGDLPVDRAGHRVGSAVWRVTADGLLHSEGPSADARDIRVVCEPRAGVYGCLSWAEAARTITGSAGIDTGSFAVADPRVEGLRRLRDARQAPDHPPIIIAADGTWHRPLTTLELAALQGMPVLVDGRPLELGGRSQSGWRQRIGNAVPCPTARAIAEQMLTCLVAADTDAFTLSSGGNVWVERATAVLR